MLVGFKYESVNVSADMKTKIDQFEGGAQQKVVECTAILDN